ncbi:S41 family peptidase [Mucilaginibacter sp. cycad4]|uniref:S41 family peptidase n=1 Tax=Mucilaginibacter sp. cycad4 TaxID=3342096 RepID=UPI002AAB7471|nr:S41 family peptidase [Mucilaginibacter gossypii]WPV01777.1 S41 family peptidase [Mucilaginibacter gossypii]
MRILKALEIIVLAAGLSACRKSAVVTPELPVSPTTGTRAQFTLDSIYLYAKQIYLWSDALPSYAAFNPRKYASDLQVLNAFNAELFDLSQLKVNPQTSLKYEEPVTPGSPKYSFLTELGSNGSLAAVGAPVLNAVLKDTVVSKNVAYVALGSFPQLNTCKDLLDAAFATLKTANPRQLVIDLRYNGGGFVETAEYVANLIAPSALNGKVMFSEQYNALLQASGATTLKNQTYYDANGNTVIYKGRTATLSDVDYTEAGNTHHFNKQSGMETVKDIYFITSAATASASELLISALKPYFNVKLVGGTTYGKPVGFFPVKIDVYNVYLSGFLIRNAQGWSEYFQGIPADVEITPEGGPVLGDPNEACLSAVLELINGTSLSTVQQQANNKTVQIASVFKSSPAGSIIKQDGMIENRLKLKK